MNPTTDERLLARIEGATLGGRALLYTLARMGSALRRDDPIRAHLLLHALQSHPFYKGGRVFFDVLELEDLMLDGPPPAPVGHASLWAVTDALVDLLRILARLTSELQEKDGSTPREDVEAPASRDEQGPAPDLPELDPSEYLYDLVVLGVAVEAGRALARARESAPVSAAQDGPAGLPSPGSPR